MRDRGFQQFAFVGRHFASCVEILEVALNSLYVFQAGLCRYRTHHWRLFIKQGDVPFDKKNQSAGRFDRRRFVAGNDCSVEPHRMQFEIGKESDRAID